MRRSGFWAGLVFLGGAFGAGLGCAGSGPDPGETGDAGVHGAKDAGGDAKGEDAGRHPSRDAGAERDEGGDAAKVVKVSGVVKNLYAAAIAGREVTLLDAKGIPHVGFTDGEGSFSQDDVALPYDVSISGDATTYPVVYLGLTERAPVLLGMDAMAVPPTSYSGAITLTVSLPDCGGTCSVTLAPYVVGQPRASPYVVSVPGSTVFPYTLPIAWQGASSPSAGLEVLVADASLTSFWYAEVPVGTVGGGSVSAGLITPSPVPLAGTLDLTTDETSTLAAWGHQGLSLQIDFGGGGSAMLADTSTTVLSVGVPDIVGATLEVSGGASESDDAGIDAIQTAVTWKTGVPLSTTSLKLPVYAPAAWTTPDVFGVSPAPVPVASKIAWTPTAAAPTGVDLVVLGPDPLTTSVLVFTSFPEIDLGRLLDLGVPLSPGPATLALEEVRPQPTLDEVVATGEVASLWGAFSMPQCNLALSQLSLTLTP